MTQAVTPQGLHGRLQAALQGWAATSGLAAMIARGVVAPAGGADAVGDATATAPTTGLAGAQPPLLALGPAVTWPMHAWAGQLHSLPSNFRLPTGTMLIAWQHYNCSNAELNSPPLRLVPPRDIADPKIRKRFSGFRFLMQELEKRIKLKGAWSLPAAWKGNPPLAIEEANALFHHVEDFFEDVHAMRVDRRFSRAERLSQFEWTSCENLMREWKKHHPDAATPDAHGDAEHAVQPMDTDPDD